MIRFIKAFISGLFVAVLGLACFWLAPGYTLEENFGLDLLFTLRGTRPAPENVVVIAIDRVASESLHLPNKPLLWPRHYHSKLIKQLQHAGAAVIVMDIFFKQARHTVTDKQFAQTLRQSGNVVLFAHLQRELLNQHGQTPLSSEQELFNVERLILPTPIIANAAAALAPFALPKYPAKVSQFWTFRVPAGDMPTLPVITLQLYLLKTHAELLTTLKQSLPAISNTIPQYKNPNTTNMRFFVSEMHNWIAYHSTEIAAVMSKLKKDPTNTALLHYLELYTGSNQRYLNFFGPPRTITTVTYDTVLNNTLPDNYSFKNKIVFVGFSERLQPEQTDNFYTVFSQKNGVDLSGVEIAATAFSNLYQADDITPLTANSFIVLIALFGFSIAFISRWLPPVTAILSSLFMVLLYMFYSYTMFTQASLWLPIIIPVFVLAPLALFAALIWQYLDTNRERKRIRSAFGYYLPDNVVNQLAKKSGHVEGSQHLIYGTCMATDAEHYTKLSENRNPSELSQLLNRYYKILFTPVRQNNGVISDVVGDSMVALWTEMIAKPDLKRQACVAALEIQNALSEYLQSEFPAEYALSTRIGLHSGELALGNVGAVDHYEYRAVGDIVNTASRIQGLNKQLGTHIIISQQTLQSVSGLLVRKLGDFVLLGKTRAICLYELISKLDGAIAQHKILKQDFERALDEYQIGNIEQARELFLQLLKTNPTDGPSHYYVQLCHEWLSRSVQTRNNNWSGIIHMESK